MRIELDAIATEEDTENVEEKDREVDRSTGDTPRADDDDVEPADPRTRPGGAPFPIVGIGASAGGLEALQAIVRRLRADNMAYVVVQHLSPVHESLLTELLGRSTEIPVTTVEDGQAVERDHIYVIPANADMEITGGTLHLKKADRSVNRLPIDSFFRSLAADAGPRGIGVILSGGGTDGTLGLKAIKAEGGLVFVQDPGTAIHPSMPQHALDSGTSDFCLPPEEIADELMRVSSHPYIVRSTPSRNMNPEGLAKIFSQLRASFGVDFTQYKHTTLERRIERRMAVHRIDSLDGYIRYIHANSAELDTLYRDMLIGVTSFFRDRSVFEALKSVVFARMLEQRPSDSAIRIWVAGCSSGEEAYSVAMCLLEHLGDRATDFSIQVFATDLDEDAIRQARHGLYRSNIELDVSHERLQRFFTRKDDCYQISRQIRDMVIFATQDLGKDPPFSRLDLVCCRNVLIYMQPPLQKKVLRIFHYSLNPEGFLLLGTSESVGEMTDLFSAVDRKIKIYVKRNVAAAAVFDFGLLGTHQGHEEELRAPREPKPMVSLQQIADRKVIERYGPPGVVINDALDILQFRGRTGPYLEPAPGAATLNILKLARPDLLMELRATIHKALGENFLVTSGPVHMKTNEGYRQVLLDAVPLQEVGVPPRCLLVLFREVTPPPAPGVQSREEEDRDPRVIELEHELASTKDFLQTTIEELEAANEELKSANEELQSSNEELQSTNEELETSKEELQSTNEELATVNEELQTRMSELGENHDDLNNVLAVANNPTILVGMDLRIRRFSQSAEKQMNLIPGDVGRPVAHLKTYVNVPNFEQKVADVINRVTPLETEVQTIDGQSHFMRVSPYKTSDHVIRGAILEFVT